MVRAEWKYGHVALKTSIGVWAVQRTPFGAALAIGISLDSAYIKNKLLHAMVVGYAAIVCVWTMNITPNSQLPN